MCYATAQSKAIADLEKLMEVKAMLPEFLGDDDLLRFHINGFAKHHMNGGKKVAEHPIMLVQPQENPKYLTPIMWGLVPRGVPGEKIPEYYKEHIRYGSGLNATSEKLFTSTHFMDSAKYRRCIVPVSGFYEPYRVIRKKGKDFSIPFFFERRDKKITKLAGIYEFTKAENIDEVYVTFAILTKKATPLFSKIHHTKKRRPVILSDKQAGGWLDNSSKRNDLQHIIDTDMPDELLFAQPISIDLYSRDKESNRPDISTPVHYEEIEIDYENKPVGSESTSLLGE